MLKVFLSHEMSGLDEEYVVERRNKIAEVVEMYINAFTSYNPSGEHIEIIDNYHHYDAPENAGRLWHLGRSIQQMEEADLVVFISHWSNSKGCKVEKFLCKVYKIPYIKL